MTDERLFERLATHAGPAEFDAAFEDRLYSVLQREMRRPGRSSRPALLLVAALLAALAISAVVGSGLIEPPWADRSVIPTPSATPSSSPAFSLPPASASPLATSRPPVVDDVAVVQVNDLAIRAGAGTDFPQLGYEYKGDAGLVTEEARLDAGERVFVIAGPVAGGGYQWFQVQPLGLHICCLGGERRAPLGWVAGVSTANSPWLLALPLACPSEVPVPVSALLEMEREEWLACFADGIFTIRGWGAEPPIGGCGYDPSDFWMNCRLPGYRITTDESGGPTGIEVIWDPNALPSGAFQAGVLLDVTGRLDHPLSVTCGLVDHETIPPSSPAPPASVLGCRTEFVVTAVAAAAGP